MKLTVHIAAVGGSLRFFAMIWFVVIAIRIAARSLGYELAISQFHWAAGVWFVGLFVSYMGMSAHATHLEKRIKVLSLSRHEAEE